MEKSKVYFTKEITPSAVLKLYEALGIKLSGKVGAKVHSGEPGNQNFIRPDFWQPIMEMLDAKVVECNTAYPGRRNTTLEHLSVFKEHGWSLYYDVDLADIEDDDLVLDIPNGNQIKKDYIGSHFKNYDSIIVLSHFKGHPMGGFGGALKQLSIGFASSRGKAYIHSAGRTLDQYDVWDKLPPQNDFLESMADAAWAVNNYFKGRIVYINVLKNMSVDCDCCSVAEDPCIPDMGMMISTDPVAIDQACIDMVFNSNAERKEHFIKRVTSRNGIHTIEAASSLGAGNREYELISID